MKILVINTIAGDTATGVLSDSISEGLISCGNEVYMACAYGTSHVVGVQMLKVGNKLDRITHALLTRITDTHGFHSTRATAVLLDKILKIRPDVVHIHNMHGYFIDIRVLINFLKRAKIPVIMTLHDCWTFTGHCVSPHYARCTKFIDAKCDKCPVCRTYPRALVDNSRHNVFIKKELFSDFDNLYIVSVSHWLNKMVEQSWLNDHPHYIIHNGVDTDMFTLPAASAKRKGVLGVANVWTETKGLHKFYELRAMLPKDIAITLVGLNRRQIRNLPIGIKGFGNLTAPMLAKLYGEAEIFVSMSEGESFGMSIVEAMACGTPVFAFGNTAQEEILNTRVGQILPDGDVEAMAEAIKNYDERIDPQECRTHVLHNFSKSEMVAKYMDLYKSLLNTTC